MPNKALNLLPQGGQHHRRSLGGLCALCLLPTLGLPAYPRPGRGYPRSQPEETGLGMQMLKDDMH